MLILYLSIIIAIFSLGLITPRGSHKEWEQVYDGLAMFDIQHRSQGKYTREHKIVFAL